MSSLKKHIISSMASTIPFSLLRREGNLPVLLPFYHTVSNDPLPFRFNYNYPSIERFEKDLEFIISHFNPISLDELLSGKNLSSSFHLTFDDGLRSSFETIAPILKRKGIPATFFLSPAFVDNQDLFHRYKASILLDFFQQKELNVELQNTYADISSLDEMAADMGIDWDEYLKNEQPYMTLEQIHSLQNEGFTIGAHSWDHPEFWLLDAERQLDEIRDSITWIVENFNPSIRAFAFPFSDFGVPDIVFETIRKENLCDISFGTAGLKKERVPQHFQRIAMDAPPSKNARKRIQYEYLAYRLKKLLNLHIAKR